MRDGRARVAMVVSLPPPYHGANVANESLWRSTLRERFACSLVDISDHRSIDNLGRFDLWNIGGAVSALAREGWALATRRPHVVYLLVSQNALAFLRDAALIVIARLVRPAARVVVHLHGAWFDQFYRTASGPVRLAVRWTLGLVHAGIVYGPSLRHTLEPWVPRLYFVPNGTDATRNVDIEAKIAARRADPVVRITYLSNLVRSKGIVDLLTAFGMLAAERPNVVLDVAGDWGPDPVEPVTARQVEAEAQDAVRRGGSGARVRFLGVVKGEEKRALLERTDLFVLPTYYPYEGHPVSIVEAMGAGCVVVSTPRGIIPETVLDGESGVIVAPRDPRALADRLRALVDAREEREALARAARQRYEREYTLEVFARRMGDVWADLAAEAGAQPAAAVDREHDRRIMNHNEVT